MSIASAALQTQPFSATEYLDEIARQWRRLCARTTVQTRFAKLGHQTVRIDFASDHLLQLYQPALRTLLDHSPADWSAELRVWDAQSSAMDVPAPQWSLEDHIARGEIPKLCDDTIRSSYNIESTVFNSFDRQIALGYHCVRHPDVLPQYELGAPLRDLLSWVLSEQNQQLLHAAAVGNETGGLLLVGKGGSGKSTSASGCLGSELKLLADDYCALTADIEPTVEAVFDSFKLFPAEARANPFASDLTASFSKTTGKTLFYMDDSIAAERVTRLPLTAIVLPTVTANAPARSRYQLVSAAAAMAALAPSTLFQLPGASAQAFKRMAQLVKVLPAYRLELGHDRQLVSAALTQLLRELTTADA